MPYESEYESEVDALESGDFESEAESEQEYDGEESEAESPFGEAMEMDLAAELLDVAGQAEMDQFLGGLIRRAGKAVGGLVRSPTGQQLVGLLRGAARKALPGIGAAIGGRLGGSTGARIGGQLAQQAGQIFGLELEGLSPEDQEFEAARRFVQLGGAAAAAAAQGAPAREALAEAARVLAPGLLRRGFRGRRCRLCSQRSGRWIRQGNNIIVTT
jgi:hypothetical protein